MHHDVHCGKAERAARMKAAGQDGIHAISFYSALTTVLQTTEARRHGGHFHCKRLCRLGCCGRMGRGKHACCRICDLREARRIPRSCGRVSFIYLETSKTCRTPDAMKVVYETTGGGIGKLRSFRFRALHRACADGLLSNKTGPGSIRRLLKRSSIDAAVGVCTRSAERTGHASTELLSGIINKRWGITLILTHGNGGGNGRVEFR